MYAQRPHCNPNWPSAIGGLLSPRSDSSEGNRRVCDLQHLLGRSVHKWPRQMLKKQWQEVGIPVRPIEKTEPDRSSGK
jgi:hypothetical protein